MMSSDDWQRVLDVNLTGTYNMCKHGVQVMMGARYGRIVNITSPSGQYGFEGQANYAASKAGMVAMTRSLSKEVAKRKITANCVSPGFVATDFIGDLPEELVAKHKATIPMKRFGEPSEIAHAVLFLATKGATYITGSTLDITGGL
jgi:3-oxoacyl-[acyl-carrier protein] reductase